MAHPTVLSTQQVMGIPCLHTMPRARVNSGYYGMRPVARWLDFLYITEMEKVGVQAVGLLAYNGSGPMVTLVRLDGNLGRVAF